MPVPRCALLLLLLLTSAIAFAREASAPPAPKPAAENKDSGKNDWVFSLLPKSLQKNPRLELTVITEMTPAGRKLPPVSPDKPAYFEAFTSGPKAMGAGAYDEKMLKQEEVERLLLRSLATNGYLPAQRPAQPPSLLIVYAWGSHNVIREADEENPAFGGNALARNILDRAALVGGEKFATKMLELFERADALSSAANARVAPGGESVIAPAMAMMNPVEMFKREDPKNEFLVDQTASDLYYVVASAYDYQSVVDKRRLLLWRTRMTVASAGVNQEISVPTLVLSAAPFFGKEMTGPEIISKRSMREGTVEVGTPTVINTPAETLPPAKK